VAQMLGYEVYMGLSSMGVVMIAGSFHLGEIVEAAEESLVLHSPNAWAFLSSINAGIAEAPPAFPSTCRRRKASWWRDSTRNTRP